MEQTPNLTRNPDIRLRDIRRQKISPASAETKSINKPQINTATDETRLTPLPYHGVFTGSLSPSEIQRIVRSPAVNLEEGKVVSLPMIKIPISESITQQEQPQPPPSNG